MDVVVAAAGAAAGAERVPKLTGADCELANFIEGGAEREPDDRDGWRRAGWSAARALLAEFDGVPDSRRWAASPTDLHHLENVAGIARPAVGSQGLDPLQVLVVLLAQPLEMVSQ